MLKATILGCGSSGGVPRVGGHWGACDPENPRNRRRRCSLLLEQYSDDSEAPTRVLIDTGPDLRSQLLDAGVGWVDGVLYTHSHADHLHGIDDLRVLAIHARQLVDVYMDTATTKRADDAFGYCFRTPEGSSYPPILRRHLIEDDQSIAIDGPAGTMHIVPIRVNHGDIDALGFRIGGLVYLPDVKSIPETSVPLFEGLDVLIIDALRYAPHISHFNVEDALAFIERVDPARSVLTNMHIDLDYEALSAELPEGVEPAYDGFSISL